ncbi:MAG TPA: hypothetical protein VNB51_03760 [Candidatus Udaeobacter sp.]|nr:hypothetical protein [Candidatus Udaeobacter sp.]
MSVRSTRRAGDTRTPIRQGSLVAAFPDHEAAVAAATAREAAGSFSAADAIGGAVLAAVTAVIFVVAGGDVMRQNLVAIVLGAPALIFAFAVIGALAGRARLFLEERGALRFRREATGEAI